MINIKRTTIGALIYYVPLFIIATILYTLFPENYLLYWILVVPIIVFLVSKFYYFKVEAPVELMKEAFLVGLYWMIVAIFFDIVFVVYGSGVGWDFFLQAEWTLPVLYTEIVVFTIIGAIKK